MHPQLETYLNRINARLKKLTPDEREQQMQEVALHLQSLVAQNQAEGLSEDEATHAALAQFGEPSKIGHDIEQQILVGRKAGLVEGLLVGAIGGMIVFVFPHFLDLLVGEDIYLLGEPFYGGFGSLAECFIEAALAGAVTSLVARRSTWKYLSRPARTWHLFTTFSQVGTVAVRMMGAGLFCGAVGGIVFGCVNTIRALMDPHCTFTLIQDMMGALAFWSLFACFKTCIVTGFLAAILGGVRRAFGRTPRQTDMKKIQA